MLFGKYRIIIVLLEDIFLTQSHRTPWKKTNYPSWKLFHTFTTKVGKNSNIHHFEQVSVITRYKPKLLKTTPFTFAIIFISSICSIIYTIPAVISMNVSCFFIHVNIVSLYKNERTEFLSAEVIGEDKPNATKLNTKTNSIDTVTIWRKEEFLPIHKDTSVFFVITWGHYAMVYTRAYLNLYSIKEPPLNINQSRLILSGKCAFDRRRP